MYVLTLIQGVMHNQEHRYPFDVLTNDLKVFLSSFSFLIVLEFLDIFIF